MSWDEDERYSDPIFRHTKKEDGLSSKDYENLQGYYACKEDTVVMRGMNFRTKTEYDKFIKKLESGEYRPERPESFTRDEVAAKAFAGSKKTFFPFGDTNLFVENAYKKAAEEKISGYGGVIIKTIIPAGSGLDVTKTAHAVEDEILYMSKEPIEYTYELVDSYEVQLQKNPVDINEYLKNNNFDDGLFNYILANHVDEITPETQNELFEKIITPYSKRNHEKEFMVDENKKLVFGEERYKDYTMKDKEIRFFTKPIYYYHKRGLFTDSNVVERVERFAEHVIEEVSDFIEMETMYADPDKGYDIYYDTEAVKELTYFCNDEISDRFRNALNASRPKTYNELNDSIRELNYRDDMSSQEKRKAVDNITKEIVSLIQDTYKTQTSNTLVERDLKDFKEKTTEAKRKGRGLKNR